MKISFVIPAYNEESYIDDCIDSIERNAYGHFHEILVVDNGSTDRTASIAKSRPKVRVVFEPNRGITHARQRGMESASGDILAYIDADTRITKEWIGVVKNSFNEYSDTICLSGA